MNLRSDNVESHMTSPDKFSPPPPLYFTQNKKVKLDICHYNLHGLEIPLHFDV
jgi:hypothetical protein